MEDNTNSIECSFVQIPQHVCLYKPIEEQKLKSGKYHGSSFSLNDEQKNNWIICVYIRVNENLVLGKNEQEIIEGCLKYLNKPKGKKRNKKIVYEYGFLQLYTYKFKKTTNYSYIEATLLTDDPKNKNFWAVKKKKSQSFGGIPSGKKRKGQDVGN